MQHQRIYNLLCQLLKLFIQRICRVAETKIEIWVLRIARAKIAKVIAVPFFLRRIRRSFFAFRIGEGKTAGRKKRQRFCEAEKINFQKLLQNFFSIGNFIETPGFVFGDEPACFCFRQARQLQREMLDPKSQLRRGFDF